MPNVTPLRPGDPRRVGRYRLTGRVDDFAGEGTARQDVFLAQRVDGEAVLAAFPGTGRAGDAAARDRFVAEARVARNIPPFCVARILDAGVEGSQPYLITEFISGPSLAEVVHDRGPTGQPQRSGPWRSAAPPGSPPSTRPGSCTGSSARTWWWSAGTAPGGALQHHPAVRRRNPCR